MLSGRGIAHKGTFQEGIEFFIRACPGPHMAERGLRIVAYQRIRGIPGLEDGSSAQEHGADISGGGAIYRVDR